MLYYILLTAAAIVFVYVLFSTHVRSLHVKYRIIVIVLSFMLMCVSYVLMTHNVKPKSNETEVAYPTLTTGDERDTTKYYADVAAYAVKEADKVVAASDKEVDNTNLTDSVKSIVDDYPSSYANVVNALLGTFKDMSKVTCLSCTEAVDKWFPGYSVFTFTDGTHIVQIGVWLDKVYIKDVTKIYNGAMDLRKAPD